VFIGIIFLLKEEIKLQNNYEFHGSLDSMLQKMWDQTVQKNPKLKFIKQPFDSDLNDLLNNLFNSSFLDENNLHNVYHIEVRDELLKNAKSENYPTPRHIAQFMADLVIPKNGITTLNVLDPTMGTAGLLIAAHELNKDAALFGIDFDRTWASIGTINLELHETNYLTRAGNCLTELLPDKRIPNFFENNQSVFPEEFDVVLMNPPFGGTFAKSLVDHILKDGNVGLNSSTVLGQLCLEQLRVGKCTAFLNPTGLLFSTQGGDTAFKKNLLENELQAIVTLPEGAMIPYNQVQSNLLIVKKIKSDNKYLTWFCEPHEDGYENSARRDLTKDPDPTFNELIRVQQLIHQYRLNKDKEEYFHTLNLSEDKTAPGGCVFWSLQTGVILKIYANKDSCYLLVKNEQDEVRKFGKAYWKKQSPLLLPETEHILSKISAENFLKNEYYKNIKFQLVSEENQNRKFEKTAEKITIGDYEFISDMRGGDFLLGVFNEKGELISDFYSLKDEKQIQSLLDDKNFPEISNFPTLQAWVLPLQEIQEEETKEEPAAASLIIFSKKEISFWKEEENYYLPCGEKLISLCKDRSGFLVKQEEFIEVRNEYQGFSGFAIGPAAWNEDGFHLFAVGVRQDTLKHDQDWRPSQFLRIVEKDITLSVDQVLTEIRENQGKVMLGLENLTNLINFYRNDKKEPKPIIDEHVGFLTHLIPDEYKTLMEKLISSGRKNFDFKFLESEFGERSQIDVFLEYFQNLGWIVPVEIAGKPCFRINYIFQMKSKTNET
jgi:predicted RNA methylase